MECRKCDSQELVGLYCAWIRNVGQALCELVLRSEELLVTCVLRCSIAIHSHCLPCDYYAVQILFDKSKCLFLLDNEM